MDQHSTIIKEMLQKKTFAALTDNVRAIVMAAEMQAGKSGIALALSCLQRLSRSDEDICDRTKLKDTLYLLTMPDTALLDQAIGDLELAKNAVVSNFNRFDQDLERYFKGRAPRLIIIDESHYGSNARAVRYSRVFDYLEATTSEHAASDFEGLRDFFEQVCEDYEVSGLDVGLTVKYKKRRPIADVETYMTDSYVVVPGKLLNPDYDYTQHTTDLRAIEAIHLLREELLKDSGPTIKGHRAMRGKYKNWVKAQWVNGDTYNNREKAHKGGTMKERTIKNTQALDKEKPLEFNQVVMPGAGEYTAQKEFTASVFSVYNESRRSNITKRIMTEADVHEMCDHFGVDHDDTLFVLYKRGEYNLELTEQKIAQNQGPSSLSTINDESQFSETQRNAHAESV